MSKRPQGIDFRMTIPRRLVSFIDNLKGLLVAVLLIGFLDAFGGSNQILNETVLIGVVTSIFIIRIIGTLFALKWSVEQGLFEASQGIKVFIINIITMLITVGLFTGVYVYAMESSYVNIALVCLTIAGSLYFVNDYNFTVNNVDIVDG